ncbi:ABC transporter substrate-binding protein [Lutibaculum baratangense]|uniref:Branched-chain amino acid ABC transporter, amino acid-binding protein n=1 Tax=Lutibaculum baratangense AMV1 TaxID=631454 RepID=V4REA7_9HYPH|nr:ABC transporter substrate-binding protein [Lutibaculum baratangense]ESR23729.1 Branched-chain amino acid ABC transporter, amino acid-binding protein [Lutibaculum baratangense AMV1]
MGTTSRFRTLARAMGGAVLALAVATPFTTAQAADPIKIGHVAALSGASAQSGEAITRGIQMAIDEINEAGGLLDGRMLELVQRDDQSTPPKGLIAARELIFNEEVAAIFGGIDSPVSLAIVPLANQSKVPFMGVWAAATGITENGADPNYVFRVSAVDALVDVKLLDYANKKFGAAKVGLMLINNPWGESNEKGLEAADEENDAVEIVGVEKFEAADVDMTPQLTRLRDAGAEAIILVVNAPPGAQVMKSRERMGWDAPVVSHWGISGGRFPELAGPTAGEAHFVQTYSFFGDQGPVGQKLLDTLKEKYSEIEGPEDIFSPVGTANAYDAMHLVALAIEQAGSTDGDAIREALENLDGPYEGLIKTYDKPFSAENHDALGAGDYIMVHYDGDQVVPTE